MNVLIITYNPTEQTRIAAHQFAETTDGCVHIVQAPPDRTKYWSFLTSKAADFGADYIIELGPNPTKNGHTIRYVNDIFNAHKARPIQAIIQTLMR